MILDDGTVVPSFLGQRNGAGIGGFARSMTDYPLRSGRVIAAYAPGTKENFNTRFWEYDVRADYLSDGSHTEIVYPHAIMIDMFGGAADFSRHTPRTGTTTTGPISLDSRVYLMCVNGNIRSAVIIGGERHQLSPVDSGADAGHNSLTEFNGIQWEVNQHGEYAIKRRGPTNPDGTVKDETGAGSSLIFTKEGNVSIADSSGKNAFTCNTPDKKSTVTGDSLIELTTAGGVRVAGGLEQGFHIGAATEAFMLGTSYREAQKNLHSSLEGGLQSVGDALQNAGAAITTTSPAAGVALSMAAGALKSMAGAIKSFEEQAEKYLSKKHKGE